MQKEYLLKIVNKYLEKNKYQIGVSEVKLTRALRMEMSALMNAYTSIGPNNLDFVDENGNRVIPEIEIMDNIGKHVLKDGDLQPQLQQNAEQDMFDSNLPVNTI